MRKIGLAPWCFWPGGEAASPDASHPGKAKESSVGDNEFSPADVPWLSWARSPQTFRHPSAASGAFWSIPTTLFRQLRVQGPQDPGAGLGARSPQRSLLLGLKIVLKNMIVNTMQQLLRMLFCHPDRSAAEWRDLREAYTVTQHEIQFSGPSTAPHLWFGFARDDNVS